MEDSKKKPIMIAVIVLCLGVAGAITYMRHSGSGGGINDIPEGKMMWVKCNNPQCNAEYEISEKEYYKEIQARMNPATMMSTPALICEKCGKPSVYKAYKCPYCGNVFFANSVPNDFEDRCPKCNKSKTEETRKARKAGGQ
jgi:DNA-directed RNA polymerase subunit RPC12/RpoP